MRFFSHLQQFASQRFVESFYYNNLAQCKSGKRLDILQSQQVSLKECSMTAQNYSISRFLKIWNYNNLPLNPQSIIRIIWPIITHFGLHFFWVHSLSLACSYPSHP